MLNRFIVRYFSYELSIQFFDASFVWGNPIDSNAMDNISSWEWTFMGSSSNTMQVSNEQNPSFVASGFDDYYITCLTVNTFMGCTSMICDTISLFNVAENKHI